MKIPALPFAVTDWSQVAPIMHPGESGEAYWRTLNIGDLVSRFRSSHHFAATSFATFGIKRTLEPISKLRCRVDRL